MFGKFKVAHLMGTTRENEDRFREVEIALTKKGYICFCPAIYDFDEYKKRSKMIDEMCYEKLLKCDICVIVTAEHIGSSTQLRISQAKKLGKDVYLWKNGKLHPYMTKHHGTSLKNGILPRWI